ncbi:MAG TPA: class I SAM-dependent methyltransferase, partial [Bradyrhizobium sp.]|nr:class I SAM-dependent methyltransferase [Bradyrhizobium sp.]
MAQHDPFTLDLFGNTSLSSGLDLGVTAFPSTLETDGDDGDAPHPPAVARIEPSADRPTSRARGETFYLAGTRGLARSWRDRARDNLSAIRLAAVIEGDQRPATAAEQAQL